MNFRAIIRALNAAVLLTALGAGTACLEPQRFELDVNSPDGLLSFGFTLVAGSSAGSLTLSTTTASVTEGGAAAQYTIQLTNAPAADVTVTPAPDANLTVSPASLTFTPADWSTPRTVTITAVDNTTRNKGGSTGSIAHSMSSADTSFVSTSGGTVAVSIADNDKLVYVTNSQHFANLASGPSFAMAAADVICNLDAARPDTTASYKAIIVGNYLGQTTRTACTSANCTNPAENSDWVLTAFTSYVRSDGAGIGTTNAAGIIVLPLQNSWSAGGTAGDKFWSGLRADWRENTVNGTSPNCTATNGDWDTLSGSFTGQSGQVSGGGSTGAAALEWTDHGCNSLAHLLCAEQ